SASSTQTKIKFPRALAMNNEFAGAGETRYASKTWLRSSRAQVWLSATTEANRNATQINPPAMRRDSSAIGSNEKLKTTTTNSEKNSMELMASFDRHSSRRSLIRVARVTLIVRPRSFHSSPAQTSGSAKQSAPPPSKQIHPPLPRAAKLDASPRKWSSRHRASWPAAPPSRAPIAGPHSRTARPATEFSDRSTAPEPETFSAACPASTAPPAAPGQDPARLRESHCDSAPHRQSRKAARSSAGFPSHSSRHTATTDAPC